MDDQAAVELPNVNDLALVIRSCDCPGSRSGQVFMVEMILRARRVACSSCGSLLAERVDIILNLTEGIGCIRSWARRLPPESEVESIDELEEITA